MTTGEIIILTFGVLILFAVPILGLLFRRGYMENKRNSDWWAERDLKRMVDKFPEITDLHDIPQEVIDAGELIHKFMVMNGHGKWQLGRVCSREYAYEQERINLKLPSYVEKPGGVTVAELKEFMRNWPELDCLGEPTEVWIGNKENTSNQCRTMFPLNLRLNDEGIETADIILEP